VAGLEVALSQAVAEREPGADADEAGAGVDETAPLDAARAEQEAQAVDAFPWLYAGPGLPAREPTSKKGPIEASGCGYSFKPALRHGGASRSEGGRPYRWWGQRQDRGL